MCYEWVKANGEAEEEEIIGILKKSIDEGLYVAFYTDKLGSGKINESGFFPEIIDIKHLLEIRVFNKEREFKAIRSQMGKMFIWRMADDENMDKAKKGKYSYKNYYDEEQYLDKSKQEKCDEINSKFKATGGGTYTLPVKKEVNIVKIRNYINYDEETGNLQIVDFRILGFCNNETKDGVSCGK